MHRVEIKDNSRHLSSEATTSVASIQNNYFPTSNLDQSIPTESTNASSSRTSNSGSAHPNQSSAISQPDSLYSGGGGRSEQTIATMIRRYRRNFLNNQTFVRPLPPTSERRRRQERLRRTIYQPDVQLRVPQIQPPDTPQPVNVNDSTFDIDTTLFPELYM